MTLTIILAAMLAVFVAACMFAVHANTMLRKENKELEHDVFKDEDEIEKLLRGNTTLGGELADLKQSLVPLTASYAISKSDEMHYKTTHDMQKAVRARLAHSLAYKIIGELGEPESRFNEDGLEVMYYNVLVRKKK